MTDAPASNEVVETARLFRDQVVEERRVQWLGPVLLEPKVPHTLLVGVALACAASVLLFLFVGSYTQKQRINGWLVPEQGVSRIVPPQAGVVTEIFVAEGAKVSMGDPLLVLSTEARSDTVAGREEVVRKLAQQRDNLQRDKVSEEHLLKQQESDVRTRLATLEDERKHLLSEISIQGEGVSLADFALKRARSIFEKGFIVLPRVMEAEQDLNERQGRLQTLHRSRAQIDREIAQLRATLDENPVRSQMRIAEIERNVAALDGQIIEAELRRQVTITAPRAGRVTAIQTELGGSADTSSPVMSIVPEGTELQAQLFSPTSAIGFIRTGQEVLLRYRSFPYQKFGLHKGMVQSISLSALSPSDLPRQLNGMTGVYGGSEPFYRITVKLDRQSVTAYGKDVLLQPGTQLEADVLLDRRSLVEWVLDPLYTITGRAVQ